jgi:hypothetical protein
MQWLLTKLNYWAFCLEQRAAKIRAQRAKQRAEFNMAVDYIVKKLRGHDSL